MPHAEKLDISVLCVEDSPVIREMLTTLLNRQVKTVYIAEDGLSGLQMYRTVNPDVVVSDIVMPNLDGLSMAREIKEHNPDQQIILVSGQEDSAKLLEAIEIGIDRYVLKPVNVHRFYEALGKCARAAIHDRTELHKRIEREGKIAELQLALDTVKTLGDTVPICSNCKSIRDEIGKWTKLEAYLQAHLDTTFSHGFCPHCMEELYPEIVAVMRARGIPVSDEG